MDKNLFGEPKKQASRDIDSLVNLLIKRKQYNIDDIKKLIREWDVFTGKDKKTTGANRDQVAKVIEGVLKTKKQGEKVILADGTFTKPLKTYMVFSGIELKCLTNDMLYMNMITKRILDLRQASQDLTDLIMNSGILSMTIASENFYQTEVTYSGLIQDYDPSFSCIGTEDFVASEEADKIIKEKPDHGTFTKLEGGDFQFFGTSDMAVICDEQMGEDEIQQKVKSMKFFRTEKNRFKEGEKIIRAGKGLKFLYQELPPETFCPAYWYAPRNVKCNLLFEFELDYNDLFEYCYDHNENKIRLLDNMVYWDTLNQCFDFWGVFALTNPYLNEEQRLSLSSKIREYHRLSPTINKVKAVMVKVERVFKDYMNAFLNNSGFERFVYMSDKIDAVAKEYDKMRKTPGYVTVTNFFEKLGFAMAITNQLKNLDIESTLANLNKVVKEYITGTNVQSIVSNLKGVASKIIKYLPMDENINSATNSCFPFIVANGPFFGDLISFNNSNEDPIILKVTKEIEKKNKEKKRQKKKVDEVITIVKSTGVKIDQYLKKYFNQRPKTGPAVTYLEMDAIAKMITEYLSLIPNGHPDFEEILKRSVAAEDKNWKFKKDPMIEEFVKDFLTAIKKTKKKKFVGARFYVVAKNKNYNFDVDTAEDIDSDIEMEIDVAAKKEKQIKSAKRKAKRMAKASEEDGGEVLKKKRMRPKLKRKFTAKKKPKKVEAEDEK